MSNHSFEHDVIEEKMGLMTSYRWAKDPKTVLFQLARYKFVSRMLEGSERVLEVGCADAFGSRLVKQTVKSLTALDIDSQMIEDARKRASAYWDILYVLGDIAAVGKEQYDAVYCLDVLEHVLPTEEGIFLSMLAKAAPFAIVGMPSLESQVYASPLSAANHVNCKSAPDLKAAMLKHYKHVLMFSMNDEVVHTGFHKMAHYIFAIGVN